MALRFLLVASFIALGLSCDYACLNTCFQAGSSTSCFLDCACMQANSIALGGNVDTPDGRHFVIQNVPLSQSEFVEEHFNCNLECGSLCSKYSEGQALIDCITYCGCGCFITEIAPSASPPIEPVLPAPAVPATPEPTPVTPAPEAVPIPTPAAAPTPAPVSTPAPVEPTPAPAPTPVSVEQAPTPALATPAQPVSATLEPVSAPAPVAPIVPEPVPAPAVPVVPADPTPASSAPATPVVPAESVSAPAQPGPLPTSAPEFVPVTPATALYSSVSMEVLEDQICTQRCSEMCTDESCASSCREEFCLSAESSSPLCIIVGILCVAGLLSVAYSVFFGKQVKTSRRKYQPRSQEGSYLSL